MDYRSTVAEIRATRDRELERIRAQAADDLARAAAARDAEIRRLASEGLSARAIAPSVGCCDTTVFEALHPEAHEAYNQRRREHWKDLRPETRERYNRGRRDRRRLLKAVA